ncbi:MAG: hypothetical protein MOGMAGMI_01853 [Candidatus Omnitrophica bacterium]|nr:hypothetical protein [Candidatus Omnitrophota bacterium]
MNTNNALTTAILRGFYAALIAGLLAGLTASQQGSTDREAVIIGAIAALGVLGARGGIEGVYDQRRNATGNVKASDVGQG